MKYTVYDSARMDAELDACENAAFSSVGGLEKRSAMVVPERSYIRNGADAAEYLRGYRDKAREMYGEDWETCEFSWRPALVIDKDGVRPA